MLFSNDPLRRRQLLLLRFLALVSSSFSPLVFRGFFEAKNSHLVTFSKDQICGRSRGYNKKVATDTINSIIPSLAWPCAMCHDFALQLTAAAEELRRKTPCRRRPAVVDCGGDGGARERRSQQFVIRSSRPVYPLLPYLLWRWNVY